MEVDDEPPDGAHFNVSPNGSIMAETPRKRQKTSKSLRDATHFLLNPSSAPLLSPILSELAAFQFTATSAYWLDIIAPQPSDSLNKLPTRLQRLVAERGKQAIKDEELLMIPSWRLSSEVSRKSMFSRKPWGGSVRELGKAVIKAQHSICLAKDDRRTKNPADPRESTTRYCQDCRGTFREDDLDWIRDIGQFNFSDEDDNSHQEEPTSDRHSGDGSGKVSGINNNRSARRDQNLAPAT